MDIVKLYEMQKVLDQRIIDNHNLHGKDLFPHTVLALQVEICELAAEWRGFKHWSNDREPRIAVEVECGMCKGKGEVPDLHIGYGYFECPNCGKSGVVVVNRLLEEYIDCLHFFLSIAVQKDWLEHLYLYEDAIEELRENGLEGGVGGAILEVMYFLMKFYMEKNPIPEIEEKLGYPTEVYYFRNSWFVFMAIGMVGFGWTWEQIAAAYVEKNQINHERQTNGY